VVVTGSHGLRGGDVADLDRARAICGRAVAQLALGVATPAVDLARGDGAAVRGACADSERACDSGDRNRARAVRHCSVTELAGGVAAPALDSAVQEQSATVRRTGGDALGGSGESVHRDRSRAARCTAVAELTGGVVTPAVGACRGDGAAVRQTGGDYRGARDAAGQDGSCAGFGRSVAELAGGVAAPALDGAVQEQSAVVRIASDDRSGAGDRGGDGRCAEVLSTAPELAQVVCLRAGPGRSCPST